MGKMGSNCYLSQDFILAPSKVTKSPGMAASLQASRLLNHWKDSTSNSRRKRASDHLLDIVGVMSIEEA